VGVSEPVFFSNKAIFSREIINFSSPRTPASSTTKTGHHDIAEILLKVALNTKNHIKSSSRRHVPLSSGDFL
jgi:hypothetical protein